MPFASVEFIFFFVVTTFLFYLAPKRLRLVVLLASSVVFYAINSFEFLLIFFGLIFTNYLFGLGFAKFPARKKAVLLVSVCFNLGVLGYFKYYNFFLQSLSQMGGIFSIHVSPNLLAVALPMGLSFQTFQALAYSIEVYTGLVPAETNLFRYSLFSSIYPQLRAGPINRPSKMFPQLFALKPIDWTLVTRGLKQMFWGFFKKLVIADQLGNVVDYIYSNDPSQASSLPLVLTAIFYAYQIYCDFSGYTDIATGAALVLGIELAPNFNHPFSAESMTEFWNRWHISLTTWIRDFLYFPLLYRLRYVPGGIVISLIAALVLSGLWHGARWTFVFWGLIHGLFLILQYVIRYFTDDKVRFPSPIKVIAVFSVFSFGQIFFKSPDVGTAWSYLKTMVSGPNPFTAAWQIYSNRSMTGKGIFGVGKYEVLVDVALIIFLELIQYCQRKSNSLEVFDSPARRFLFWYVITASIFLFGGFERREFIYFQF